MQLPLCGAEDATADLVTRCDTASLLSGIVARAVGGKSIAVDAVLVAGV